MNLTFVLKEDYLKLLWFMFFDQSLMFRIQQLKQLLEDSTSDDEDGSSSSSSECKEKHKRRKKKEKHKKRKKEKKKKKKRKHKSSKSNESSDSDWQAVVHAAFSSLRSNTGQSTEARGIREDEEGVTPRRRPSGVTHVTHLPSSEDVTTGAGVVSSQVLTREWLISGRKALSAPPPCWALWFLIPQQSQGGRTKGVSEDAPPGAVTLQSEAT